MHGQCTIWNEEHTHPIQRSLLYLPRRLQRKRDLDEDVALAIGAYESAFLANIVASYVFKEIEECFAKCIFGGIYRDDGLVVFAGRQNKHEIQVWLWKYQSLVNKLAGGNYLKFTIELWLPPPANTRNSPVAKDKKERGVTVVYNREFPFLDMKMCWDEESGI
eukprot:4699357-Ditylum_brightwellii.AAC.1